MQCAQQNELITQILYLYAKAELKVDFLMLRDGHYDLGVVQNKTKHQDFIKIIDDSQHVVMLQTIIAIQHNRNFVIFDQGVQ